MTPKHPNGVKKLVRDTRFDDPMFIVASARCKDSANLTEKQWQSLRKWVDLQWPDSDICLPDAAAMQYCLGDSNVHDWREIKVILARRNWPMILSELAEWREKNQHWRII
jgi:hypothetical protein